MTRKDYELIAMSIRHNLTVGTDSPECDALVHGLARAFAIDNPRFDSARFLAACGVK